MIVKSSRAEVVQADRKDARAEFAIDADHALLVDHLGLLLRRETADHPAHMLRTAAAAPAERDGREQAHLVLFVEQPPEQGLERQAGIGELAGADGLADHSEMLPFGMIEPRV